LLTGLGEMSATMLAPGMSRRESRNATKRGARNSRLSWVSSTTLALPPSIPLICALAASPKTLPVRYCGAFKSEVAGGATTVLT
jgi:hypothetical protein